MSVVFSVVREYKRLDDNLTVPEKDKGNFIRGLTWEEMGQGDNVDPYPQILTPSNAGLLTRYPNIAGGIKYDYIELSDEWLWFIWQFCDWSSQRILPRGKIEYFYQIPGNHRTFAYTTPGTVMDIYRDLMVAHRAFTEDGSPEGGFRDPVTGRNMSFGQNINYLLRPTGGFLGRVIKTVGIYHYIEALDVLKPPPSFEEVVKKPWLYFWATQSDKSAGSTRFPQVKNANEVHGHPPAGLALPLLSKGGEFCLPKVSCVSLVNGAAYTPYVPKPNRVTVLINQAQRLMIRSAFV